jgi:cytoplasmic iron level regulating protein YaaA (DUF328/UPF0246 family)
MLTVISPAKTLDYETPPVTDAFTQPTQLTQSRKLIRRLRELGSDDLSRLMSISDNLAELNRQRYRKWKTPFKPDNARQALFAFKGDVYIGLDAYSLDTASIDYAQQHLRILSGLYGLLRPLDLMQPYRLEMGTKFANPRGNDLYQFWGDSITKELNKQLKSLKTDTLLNLASNEYFKAVNKKLLNAEIISPAFKDLKNGKYKIISFYAKKARGLMSAWVIQKGITDPKQLKKFKAAGYRYNADMSAPNAPTFTRDHAPS